MHEAGLFLEVFGAFNLTLQKRLIQIDFFGVSPRKFLENHHF